MRKKPGVIPKDSSLTFNPDKKGVLGKDIKEVQKQIRAKSGRFLPKDGIPREKKEKKVPTDVEAAYQMLQDMRWVYRNVRGRTKLKQMVQDDDRQFVFMVKELMKIESALMSAKVRKEDTGKTKQRRNFFVILKGLEDDPKILESAQTDKMVNMKQILGALNPLDTSYEPEEAVDRWGAPEQLQKKKEE